MGERGISRMRLSGFLRKEVRQILRDPSSILLGIVMPVVLLFLFGYGVSLDPQEVPVALVVEDLGPPARDLAARLALSRYFTPVAAQTMAQAEAWVRSGRIDGIVRIRGSFSAEVLAGQRATVQLVVNGVDANRARLIQNYARGVVATWTEMRRVQAGEPPGARVAVEHRVWFNDAVDSRHFLVPGLLTLIMTLIGTLLTALVIAREWERGTMEAILATPLRTDELLLGKVIPYFGLGMTGMALSVILGATLFDVPLRGSPLLLVALSALFLLAALGLGLMISAFTRVQFVAAQISVVVGFLPAFFLSGLLFDLQSTPPFIRAVSHLIPARYFVTISQTLFLAGNVWEVLLPAAGALAVMAVAFLGLARHRLGKRMPP